MKSFDIVNESFEKIAKTKAQKMINGGRLAYDNAQKLFQKVPVSNNINNRINAKAKRMIGGVVPSKLSAKSYRKVSKVDSLGSAAPINSNRLLKHQGHENSKVVRELNKQTSGNSKVSRTTNLPLEGESGVGWMTSSGKPVEWNIEIPSKNSKYNEVSSNANRELRGLTARHEISGEATSQSRMLRALKNTGLPTGSADMNVMRINGHNNPDVLTGDAKFVRQLSPEAKKRFAKKNVDNITNINNSSYKSGRNMNESELMNTLRQPGAKINSEKDPGKISTSYFERKSPSRAEEAKMMQNMGTINGVGSQHQETLGRLIKEYQNTPFNLPKKKAGPTRFRPGF